MYKDDDKKFDDLLKEKLSAYGEEIPDVWAGIESGLARRRRWVVLRRASYAAVAAAACLVGGLFLFGRGAGNGAGSVVAAQEQVAEVRVPEESPEPSAGIRGTEAADEVAPIEEQIKSFVKSSSVAQVEVSPAQDVLSAQPEPDIVRQDSGTGVSEVSEVSEAAQESRLLTEADLPAGFWDEEEPVKKSTHTFLSILSNLSAGASDEALSRIYKGGVPMHSASQTGNGNAASGVVPVSSSPSFDMPLAFGVQARVPLGKGFSAGFGLNLTYLVSQYDALVNSVYHAGVYNQLWYVGIPVNLYYNIFDTPEFGAYAFVGGAAEKCVYQRYVFGSDVLSEKVDGIQYSADLGIGLEYWFAPKMGIYADPSIVYYFDNLQPLSIRTQQPLQMRFEVGLRFKL